MEIVEIPDHPYFIGLQAHPEFLSRPLKSSPCYLGLILEKFSTKYDFILKLKLDYFCKIFLSAANNSSLDHYLNDQKIIFEEDSLEEPVQSLRKLSLVANVSSNSK